MVSKLHLQVEYRTRPVSLNVGHYVTMNARTSKFLEFGGRVWWPRPLWARGRGPSTQKKVGVHEPILELAPRICAILLILGMFYRF